MISVCICTYNPNEKYLNRVINSILSQDLEKQSWEFFIVDNNSAHPVSNIDIVLQNNIKVVVEKTPGLTAARKCANNIANGDIIVFVDDDNILNPDYLSKVEYSFEDKSIGILSGAILPEYEQEPEEWFYTYEEMIAIRRLTGTSVLLNDKHVYNGRFPIGAGMAVRKVILNEYFCNHLTAANYIEGRKGNELSSGEDIDLDFFALSIQFKIGICPLLKMKHIIPASRVSMNYIKRLTVSSLNSSYLINQKWKVYFGENVIDCFDLDKPAILIRLIWNMVLGSISRKKYLRFVFLKSLYKYQKALG